MAPDDSGAANASAGDASSFGAADLEWLSRFRAVRARSVALARPLSHDDMTAQSMADASPVKWHLAHTTWFFETFLILPQTRGEAFDPAFGLLFNSYYEAIGERTPRAQRGLMTRPGVDAVLAYRQHVDSAMERLIASGLDERGEGLLAIGLAHEEQHQELILTDVLHLLSHNPLQPAYAAPAAKARCAAVRLTWSEHAGGVVEIGAGDDVFAFDNERPRHRALLQPHRLADRLVTNGEWLHFMEEGGYRRPELWLSDGWAAVQGEGWSAPGYWRADRTGEWTSFGLDGRQALDPHAPAAHLSFYEADAYARWAGARLPTEFEWEAHVAAEPAVGEEPHAAAGASAGKGLRQVGDRLWQWTASAYLPYPGFAPEPGAVGEYNGKFMSGQMVLRGGSFATSPDHSRATYRNFFPPAVRWQFTGLRLAQDVTMAAPSRHDLLDDVLAGLRRPRKQLPSKHLYDAEGSRLFEEITHLPEYYPTRTERALLTEAAPQIAERLVASGAGAGVLVEFGSGASVKTRILLDALPALSAYAPIDISPSALDGAASALSPDYPKLTIRPVLQDFTGPIALPAAFAGLPRVGFFPGSTIGNFTPEDAESFLRHARESLGAGSFFLIGVDLVKDVRVLEQAYDDAQGVTAAFDLNILARINRELAADFDLESFSHRAVWSETESRIEMRLESRRDQIVTVAGERFKFVAGETIHTESSHKYRVGDFADMAARAGWTTVQGWKAADPFGFLLTLLQA